MHFGLLSMSVIGAVILRLPTPQIHNSWQERWHSALTYFLLPPLLIFTTSIALICMGTKGEMLGKPMGLLGEISYVWAWLLVITWLICLVYRSYQGWQSCQNLKELTPSSWQGYDFLLLDTDRPIAARVGFWTSQLVLSKGLFTHLGPDHIKSIIDHESAHAFYRDTFYFFWLGWLEQCSKLLPNSQLWWRELLLLREMRADQWAKQRVDYLLLAESLLTLAQFNHQELSPFLAAPINPLPDRLEQRIDYLLQEESGECQSGFNWWWLLGLMPLGSIGFHSL
jgi:Zn-dependent protease with chaperone function